jgi:hypothetical protein
MADGLRRVPVQAEMAARDREVSGNGQFFAAPRMKQRTVVANAEPEGGARKSVGARTDFAEQVDFAGIFPHR